MYNQNLRELIKMQPKIQPTQLQQEILPKLYSDTNSKKLIVLPCGTGKTYLIGFWLEQFYKEGKKVLFIAHRKELLEQTYGVFEEIFGTNKGFGYLMGNTRKNFNAQITFGSVQTLNLNYGKFKPEHFDLIVIDEAHHITATTYTRLMNYFKPKYWLGLTATPYRLDGCNVVKAFDNNVIYSLERNEAIEKGYLVPFHFFWVKDNVDYSDIRFQENRYSEKDLNRKLIIPSRNKAIVEEFKKRLRYRKTLCFCGSVKHCEVMKAEFTKQGFNADVISYKTPKRERVSLLKRFRENKLQILITRDIFNEGISIPDVDGIMFLRPSVSKTIFEQQLGRGLRMYPNKRDVVVIDFIANFHNVHLISKWITGLRASDMSRDSERGTYTFNCGSVTFTPEVIDIMDLFVWDKERCKKEYFAVKEQLKKQPHTSELPCKLKSQIYTIWNNYANFLIDINEPPKRNAPLDYLIKQYNEQYQELGRHPNRREFKSIGTLKRLGLSQNEFRRLAGHNIKPSSRTDIYTKDECTEQVKEYIKINKSIPTKRKVPQKLLVSAKAQFSTNRKKTNGWSNLLLSLGYTLKHHRRGMSWV
jgi:superfamily II DNA or RNA helicase